MRLYKVTAMFIDITIVTIRAESNFELDKTMRQTEIYVYRAW